MSVALEHADTETLSIQALAPMLQHQREAFLRDGFPDTAIRLDRLHRLQSLLQNNQAPLCEAIAADFGSRPSTQTRMEIMGATEPLKSAIRNLKRWMKPERRPVPLALRVFGGKAHIFYQPLGVVGNVAPWNFPVALNVPVITDALAAGNRVMIKPSELTPVTSALLKELIEKQFDASEIAVVLGGQRVGAAFCALPFDHLLFTGAPGVARHVLRAAADNLVPVTLELGGKCPVVIGAEANLAVAADRVIWGKIQNAGQICLAPDYVFVADGQQEDFIAACRDVFARFYPSFSTSPDYVSIINERHYQRITGYIDEARQSGIRVESLQPSGQPDRVATTRFIAPAIIVSPVNDLRVAREEIFGPILSMYCYQHIDQVIEFINRGPRPLAVYYFGKNRQHLHELEHRTTSGGMCINDIAMHAALDTLPLGGVGNSGMGSYHGFYGFRQFSHAKAVYSQGWFNIGRILNPPYGSRHDQILDRGIGKAVPRGSKSRLSPKSSLGRT